MEEEEGQDDDEDQKDLIPHPNKIFDTPDTITKQMSKNKSSKYRKQHEKDQEQLH